MLPGANGYQVCRTLRNGIGVHSSDRCHCVTSWPKGVAELNGSSAASYRRNRTINAQYKCGKTTLLMISVRSFVTGDRPLARPDQKVTPGPHQFCAWSTTVRCRGCARSSGSPLARDRAG